MSRKRIRLALMIAISLVFLLVALFLAGVRAEIGGDLDVVGTAGNVRDAVVGILLTRPDVAVVDVHLPDGGGRAIIAAGLAEWPEAVFLALSVSDAASGPPLGQRCAGWCYLGPLWDRPKSRAAPTRPPPSPWSSAPSAPS